MRIARRAVTLFIVGKPPVSFKALDRVRTDLDPPRIANSMISTDFSAATEGCCVVRVIASLILLGCGGVTVGAEPEAGAGFHEHAVVAADHPLASEAGVEMLRQGGNVVDAAVATAFTLSVVRPESSGLGGGGFMVIWNADEQQGVALDYRERAPLAATRDMFVSPEENGGAGSSQRGGIAVAVPGEVAGLLFALEQYGTLSREQVLAPALRATRQPIAIDPMMRGSQAEVLGDFMEDAALQETFPALFELYLNRGLPRDDAAFRSPLGPVLERIAAQGASGFYEGEVAADIVSEVQRRGGIIVEKDFRDVGPVVREPLRGELNDCSILTMPPPSSGGIALVETLKIIAAWDERHPDARLRGFERNSADYVHLLTEAFKHAFADRAQYLGDADFVDVPIERLTSDANAAALAARIALQQTFPPEHYGRFAPADDAGTSHFSVIDSRGNAVACTATINTTYGSYVVTPRYGIVLNNEMDDFTAVPGEPNAFGLIQSEANAVEAGKKPLSSMTPTILLKDGRASHVAGASGGPRIITATLQVLLNMAWFGDSPAEAVAAPRFHHQWLPDQLLLERDLPDSLVEELQSRGHEIARRGQLAAAQAAASSEEGVRGGSDPRKGGEPAGW